MGVVEAMRGLEKIRQWLAAFVPFDEQERADKAKIEQYLCEEKNLLTRENAKMHFTASAWVLNPDKTKVLMLYHNIYNSWSWSGGHADGEGDLLAVALREVREETGLSSLKPVMDAPISAEILAVQPHYKKGSYISAHLHLNLTFLFHNEKEETLQVCPDENSKVAWFLPDAAVAASTESYMRPIYEKLNKKSVDKGLRKW